MSPGPVVRGVEFRLLGAVEVALDARSIGIGSAKQRALLALLLLRQGTVVSADALIEALWNGHPPPSAQPTLRSLVARLRQTLHGAGLAPAEAVLRGKDPGYVLETEPDRIDALRFAGLVERARVALAHGEAEPAARDLRAGLALWRGAALADLSDWEFAQVEARRLDQQRLAAVEELAETELLLGRPAEALTRLEPLVEAHSLRERAWAGLMLARYRLGRQADALAAYHQIRAILADELGIDPGPALRELHDRILRQSPELDIRQAEPPDRARAGRPAPALPTGVEPFVSGTTKWSAAGPRHNLPVALTSFVGRTRELLNIETLLEGARLLTLTGVGGVGKTRLALRWAADAVPRYPDGARLVEFAAIRDPALVVPAATTAIGFLPNELQTDGSPLLEALCQRISTRGLLLILDNCEHLIQPISQLAHALLATCPQLAVLATSREVLGIPGEMVFQVPPLTLPPVAKVDPERLADSDAVRLFCERARCAEPGFQLTSTNAEAVVHICQHLDGIALALELAAARVRVLGAHQIAQRLTDRLRLLAVGARTTAPRHQTLRAAIDWSYQLLAPAEQNLLANLSVFPASFDLDAAEAVNTGQSEPAGPGFQTLDLLARLVDKSLVVVSITSEQVRYRLLETIREYARQKLDATGAADATHRRHHDFFLAVAETHPIDLAWARRINLAAADLDNFRAALTWSLARGDHAAIVRLVAVIWPYWETTGGTGAEGLDWLERAVATPGAPLSARAEVRAALAMALRHRGANQMNRCVQLCEEAIAMAAEGGDLNAVGNYKLFLWEMALSTGQLDRAEHHARDAHSAHTSGGSSLGLSLSHYARAWLHIHRRDYRQAHEHLHTAVTLGRLHWDDWVLPQILATQALVSALTGHTATAEELTQEAVQVAQRLPTCEVSVIALARAAQAAVLSGRLDSARTMLTDLLQLLHTLGFQRWTGDALELTAIILVATDPGRAATMLGAARTPRELLGESTPSFIADPLARRRQRTADALGTQRYAQHEHHGRKLTIHQALAFALDALRPKNGPADTTE